MKPIRYPSEKKNTDMDQTSIKNMSTAITAALPKEKVKRRNLSAP